VSSATAEAFFPGQFGDVNAAFAGGHDVDVADPCPGANDEIQRLSGAQGRPADLRAADHQDVHAVQRIRQLLGAELRIVNDLDTE
jgi:hypothetical protein